MIGSKPICPGCLWFDNLNIDGITCKAFPKGIPDEILNGDVIHDEIRPDQEGDFIYEGPDPEEE